MLGSTPAPSTIIDACLPDGFHLNSGVKSTGDDGVLLVGGEAFAWRPWMAGSADSSAETKTGERGPGLLNEKGQWEVGDEAWGILKLVWPKTWYVLVSLGPSIFADP